MKTKANARPTDRSLHRRWIDRIAAVDDGNILRVAFFALLFGTASVLYVDYRELTANEGPALSNPLQPILPPATDSPASPL